VVGVVQHRWDEQRVFITIAQRRKRFDFVTYSSCLGAFVVTLLILFIAIDGLGGHYSAAEKNCTIKGSGRNRHGTDPLRRENEEHPSSRSPSMGGRR
jgi:hypothetical protein